MKNTFASCFFAMVLIPASAGIAADWPGFLGPERDGTSPETGLMREWPESGPDVLWTKSLGEGFGAPSVIDGEAFVLDRVDNQQDVLRCFDLETGEEKWSFGYDAPGRLSYNGSRSTPQVTDTHVFTVGPFGDVYCVSRETHQPVWNKSLQTDFNGPPPNWGFSQSPLLYKNLVIVAPMSAEAGVVALNRENGDVVWKSGDIGGDAYTSPMLYEFGGVEQVLMLTKSQLAAFAPETGEVLWSHGDEYSRIPIPSPAKIADNRLFVTGGYDAGSMIIEVTKDGDAWKAEVVKRIPEHGAQIHQVTLHEGHLYANFNTNENLRRDPDGLVCMNLDGDIVWQTKGEPDFNRGGFIIADGLIIALGGEDGVLRLIEATAEKYNELSSFKAFEAGNRRGNNIWAPLVLSDGKLLIRDQSQLKCLNVARPKPAS